MTERDPGTMATDAIDLAASIRPLLANKPPGVQGGALAELVALWVAGHHPALREMILPHWFETMKMMIPIAEREIFADGPRPEGWPQ